MNKAKTYATLPRDLNLPHAKVVKLKEENLMYSAMREKEVQEQKENLEQIHMLT